jgi:Holliday junction resolvasome RuvABC DNA-binding subunit
MNKKILEKLSKLEISQTRYQEEYNQLSNLGFKEKQINKMILRTSSKNTIQTLVQYFEKLNKFISHKDLTRISSKNGGGKTLLKMQLKLNTNIISLRDMLTKLTTK